MNMSDNKDFYDYENDGQLNDLQESNGHEQAQNDQDLNEQNSADPDFNAIKKRVREMEEEAEKLKQLQTEMEQQMQLLTPTTTAPVSLEDKMEADLRSIYVGNVDYSSTAQELEAHFHGCGSINRVTILCDKFSGHPKGFAYIEFVDKDSVQTAMALDDSLFKGRQIKVSVKRTNRPGISSTDRPPRGGRGGGFVRGRGRGGFSPFGGFRGATRGAMRGRGRGFYHYAPY